MSWDNQMKTTERGRKFHIRNLYAIYSLLFLTFGVIIFTALLIRHNSFVMNGDCFNQAYPTLAFLSRWYRKILPDLLRGQTDLYSMTIGFGDDVIGALNCLGCMDIFTMICVLFPEQLMSYAYTLITLLRFYLGSIVFLFYAGKKGLTPRSSLLGALMYAYSFYALGMGLTAFTFSTIMVWFPLIIYCLDQLLECAERGEWKIEGLFIITLFFLSLTGFYFLYMAILAAVFYFLVQGIDHLRRGLLNVTSFFHCLLWAILHGFVGVGLGGIILLPALWQYLSGSRTQNSAGALRKLLALPGVDDMRNAAENLFLPADSAYEHGEGWLVLTVFIVLFLFLHARKRQYGKKILFVVLAFLGYLFPQVGLIMNGMAYSVNRWTFITAFFVSYLTASMAEDLIREYGRGDMIADSIAGALLFALYIVLRGPRAQTWIRVIVFGLIWAALIFFLYREKEKSRKQIYLISFGNIVLLGFFLFAPIAVGGSGVGASFKALNFVHNEIRESGLGKQCRKDQDNGGIYRYDLNDTSLDASLLLDCNTTYVYYSMCNGNLIHLMEELRVSPSTMESYLLQGLDGRQVLESLLSVRTFAVSNGPLETVDNDEMVPFGFTCHDAVSEKTIEGMAPLQKMNTLLTSAVLSEDRDTNQNADSVDGGVQEEIPCKVTYGEGISVHEDTIDALEGSTIRITFEPITTKEPGQELYLIIDHLIADSSFKYDIDVSGRYIRILDHDREWFYKGDYSYVVNIENSASAGVVELTFEDTATYELKGIHLVINNPVNFKQKVADRSKYSLKNVTFEHDTLKGSLSLPSDQWLIVTLPYSDGFTCTVDGEKAEIEKADYCFMAVHIPPGEHEIQFRYCSPGLKEGIILSLLSLLALIVWSAAVIRKHNGRKLIS